MSAFFIPGLGDDNGVVERAYGDMRAQVELETGRRPQARRILRLWIRRGRIDCVIEVGKGDPLRGGTVMAIFDMGAHQPFVMCWQPEGVLDDVREVLGCSAYSVLEFDS